MTTVDPDFYAFLQALPAGYDVELRATRLAQALVHTAVDEKGWTPEQLARYASRDMGGAVNLGALITARLRQLAQSVPPQAPGGRERVHVGCCPDGGGWLYDESTDPPRVTKCPGNGGGDPA